MKRIWLPLAACSFVVLLSGASTQGAGPLPEFTFKGVALHPKNLSYAPNQDLIHPTIIKTEGRIKNPLGKYYLYYAPHKHVAISMAYSDSMEGPWKEYKANPVIKGPSAPDVRWIVEKGKFFAWGHRKNSQTELWTSTDGIHFEYQGVSVSAKNIGTRNATYTRMYEYPLKRFGSKYVMLYSGFIVERGIRCVWLAYSKDAENWTQLKTPLVEPIQGENNDCYGPSLLRWKNRNFIVYQDHTTWRGGNIKYVEVDSELNPVGNKGKRYVLLDPPSEPPLNNRYRGAEFYFENGRLYLYSSASKNPRIIVYATAEIKDADSAPAKGQNSKTKSSTCDASARNEDAPTEDKYPSKDKLPTVDKLPDPFRFFGTDRWVKNKEDWKERRAEMLRMIQHYSAGPAFPQTHNAKVVNLESKEVYNGKATHYVASLAVGPNHSIKYDLEYVIPKSEGPKPLLLWICPRANLADENLRWREKIIDRGYGFAWVLVGRFQGYKDHGPVKDAFPKIKGNTMMAWVWAVNEMIHYLDKAHKIDKVIVTGTSRFGKTAVMAGALNERIDLTVPVCGGFGVRRFNRKDQKQPASAFAGRCWSNDVFPTFAGQLNKLPIDQHFVGALIAPRGLLAIMGNESTDKNVGHLEAYEALVPVYDWLGAKDRLGLYNHAPRGHAFDEDDYFTILDFADQIFSHRKPESGKQFDKLSNPDLTGFEWKAPKPTADEKP